MFRGLNTKRRLFGVGTINLITAVVVFFKESENTIAVVLRTEHFMRLFSFASNERWEKVIQIKMKESGDYRDCVPSVLDDVASEVSEK